MLMSISYFIRMIREKYNGRVGIYIYIKIFILVIDEILLLENEI